MRVLREDGFKTIHSFGIAMLGEQKLAGGEVGWNGVGVYGQGMSKGLAGLLCLLKVEQSIAKKKERRGVPGMLLGVRLKERSGFRRPVLRAKPLCVSHDGAGLGVRRTLQSGENERERQREKKTAKV
jgi:hypothetical protein